MSSSDLGTIQGAYEAFNRGDVPAVLAVMADDVEWFEWEMRAGKLARFVQHADTAKFLEAVPARQAGAV